MCFINFTKKEACSGAVQNKDIIYSLHYSNSKIQEKWPILSATLTKCFLMYKSKVKIPNKQLKKLMGLGLSSKNN